jgi:hypothetical protein
MRPGKLSSSSSLSALLKESAEERRGFIRDADDLVRKQSA